MRRKKHRLLGRVLGLFEGIPVYLVSTLLFMAMGSAAYLYANRNNEEDRIARLGKVNMMVRIEAVHELADERTMAAVPKLLEMLEDPAEDESVRLEVIKALGDIGDAVAVGPLVRHLREGDSERRRRTAEALGKLGDPKAVQALTAMLMDDDVKYTAIWALGNIQDDHVTAILTGLLDDPDTFVRFNAHKALQQQAKNG